MLEKLPDAVGHALSGLRAGLDEITFNSLGMREGLGAIMVGSLAFADHAPIPARYTADGEGLSPPLQWTGMPSGSAATVLIVEDADSPTPSPLVHAIAVDLPGGDGALSEAAFASHDNEADPGLHAGRNSLLQAAWMPPDPPPGHGVHRYAFQVFALDSPCDFSETPGREEVIGMLKAHAVAAGLLIGTCERPDGSIKIGDAAPAGPAVAG